MTVGPVPSSRAALVAGIPVDDVTIEDTLRWIDYFIDEGRARGRTFQIATVNVDFVVTAQADDEAATILRHADLCLADGMPLVWDSRLRGTPLRDRTTGADLVPALVEHAAGAGHRTLFFGSSPGVAERAAELMRSRFPGATVFGLEGPQLPAGVFVDEESIAKIVEIGPDIICVAFGNPKQEKWIKANRERVGVPVLIGVGGTLDLLTAGKRRAPRWVGRLGLEWVFRAVQEPVRLGRRYLNDIRVFGPQFLMSLLFWARRHRQRDRAVTITWAENAVDVQFHSTAPLSAADKGAVLAAVRQARRMAAEVRVGPCTAQQGVVLAQLGA